eukprot:scaffold24819_cov72-Skeletonema_dohrnii-CCMP3373.AAC.1
MEPMEINGSVDKNDSTNDDAPEDEYEPIISTPSLQSNGKKLGVSVNQHKIKALKWISFVLATAVLLYLVKDMFDVRMNREETVAVQDLEGEVVPSIKQQQIANYIKGTAIIRNIHITHHAGTSLCGQMGKVPNEHTPGFACMGKGRDNDTYWPEEAFAEAFKASPFHLYNETEEWVTFWRQYYHFMSGEYNHWEKNFAPNELGIPGDPSNETQDLYWEYANSGCADNYALRVLTRE